MKIGILSRRLCRLGIDTIDYFDKKGMTISLIIIETDERYRFSKTEKRFRTAHDEYKIIMQREKKGTEKFLLILKILWIKLPIGLRTRIEPIIQLIIFGRFLSMRKKAKEKGIPIVMVKRHSSFETKSYLESHHISYVLLTSSAWLTKEPLLSMENTKIINAHCSKLPNHRSLDSLPWSVLENDKTGLTAHFVDDGVDTGPILLFIEVDPKKGDTLITLRERIDQKRPEIFLKVVFGLGNGTIFPIPQDLTEGVHHRPMTVNELLHAEEILQKKSMLN